MQVGLQPARTGSARDMRKRIVVALVVAVLGLGAAGCGKSDPSPAGPPPGTPPQAVATGAHAALAGSLTHESRQVLIGNLAAEMARVRGLLTFFNVKGALAPEDTVKVNALTAVLRHYRVRDETLSRAFNEARGGG